MGDQADFPINIPTPPFSPRAPPPDSDNSITDVLQSLVAFYHEEMMWVCRTRAWIEMWDATNMTDTSSSSTSSSTIVIDGSEPIAVKKELHSPTMTTRWSRRKPKFNLRLKDMSSKGNGPISVDQVPNTRGHILELFEGMMEARMESCIRIDRLVKRANRADLHVI